MFALDFMVNAFAVAGIVAVVSGIVGFFLVMRSQTFAGHALSHIGFAGATGAGLIGLAPIWSLIGFTLVAGIGMGMLGERITGRDVAIGVVLALRCVKTNGLCRSSLGTPDSLAPSGTCV